MAVGLAGWLAELTPSQGIKVFTMAPQQPISCATVFRYPAILISSNPQRFSLQESSAGDFTAPQGALWRIQFSKSLLELVTQAVLLEDLFLETVTLNIWSMISLSINFSL